MRSDEVVETQDTRLCLQAVVDFLEEDVGVGGLLLAACAACLATLMLRSGTEPAQIGPTTSVTRLTLLNLVVVRVDGAGSPEALIRVGCALRREVPEPLRRPRRPHGPIILISIALLLFYNFLTIIVRAIALAAVHLLALSVSFHILVLALAYNILHLLLFEKLLSLSFLLLFLSLLLEEERERIL